MRPAWPMRLPLCRPSLKVCPALDLQAHLESMGTSPDGWVFTMPLCGILIQIAAPRALTRPWLSVCRGSQ